MHKFALCLLSKATRGMQWYTATKRYFKRFFYPSFSVPNARTTNSSQTSAFLSAVNIIALLVIQNLHLHFYKACKLWLWLFADHYSCYSKLLLDYAMIQNLAWLHNACSSHHAIKTWIYLNFSVLHTLSIVRIVKLMLTLTNHQNFW